MMKKLLYLSFSLIFYFQFGLGQTLQEFQNAGIKKLENQDFEGALKDFEEALKLDKKNAELYAWKGFTHLKMEKYAKATSDINHAIKLDDSKATFYHYRAVIRDSLKRYEESLKDYAKAIKLNPQDAEIFVSRANSFLKRKDFNTVVSNLNVAIQLNRKHATAYYLRGLAKFRLVDSVGACNDWKLANEMGHPKAKEALEQNCQDLK